MFLVTIVSTDSNQVFVPLFLFFFEVKTFMKINCAKARAKLLENA